MTIDPQVLRELAYMTHDPQVVRDVAENMIRLHGDRARGWADAHALSHIGTNRGRVRFWQSVADEIDALTTKKDER